MKHGKRLIASVASGLLAAALSLWYGASLQAGAEQERQEMLAAYGGDLVSVCVASRDIDAGETIDEGCVRVEEWVAGMLPSGALTSVDDAIGKQATSAIPEQAVLCPLYFEARSGSLDIPEGRVAVSVGVDAAHAVGGSIEPGTSVDVYVSANGVADRLCGAHVIDTSAQGQGAASGDLSWVTLAVEPDRVTEVLAATAKGTIALAAPGEGANAGVSDDSVDTEASSDAVGEGSSAASAGTPTDELDEGGDAR